MTNREKKRNVFLFKIFSSQQTSAEKTAELMQMSNVGENHDEK